MRSNIALLLDELQSSLGTDEFLTVCDRVVEELERTRNAFDSVEAILRLMEENDGTDFGTPGPLVHFVERFYRQGYEEKLVESLGRRPTRHTLWMLNRVINGCEEDTKEQFLRVLDQVLLRRDLPRDVYESAMEFRWLH